MLNWLNGKKTVIGAILHYGAVALTAAGKPQIAQIVDLAANAIMAAGLAHKAAKAVGLADQPSE